jgi:hypothetical protein
MATFKPESFLKLPAFLCDVMEANKAAASGIADLFLF